MMPIRTVKEFLLNVPLFGAAALSIWRLFKDPYLGFIGERINKRLPKWSKQTVVQIGANDGTRFDPVYALLRNRPRWKALFVEPIPNVFSQLVKNYGISNRFMFECAAISDSAGDFSFYYLSQDARAAAQQWHEYFDLVGSLDRLHVLKALAGEAERLEKHIIETRVPVITLQMLLTKWNIRRIDVLVVDAEGYDWKIVRQALNMGLRPEIILFEHSNLLREEREAALCLLDDDYHIDDVGIDFLCMKKAEIS